MQYSLLKSLIVESTDGTGMKHVSLERSLLMKLLAGAISNKIIFDEVFYLATNPGIKKAIAKKEVDNGASHYLMTGYFEGRMPRKFLVDEKCYIENNSDVADGVRKGLIKGGQAHFESNGFREGRSLIHPLIFSLMIPM